MISIAERHKYIKEQLSRNGFIRVQDVSEQLGVTGATIRKDLRILESQGVLYRTHGSATPVLPHVMDLSVDEKTSQHRAEKQAIALAAQELVTADDGIILASGSTVTAFAEILHPVNAINVVTPALGIAVLMNGKDNVKVFLLGGEMYKNSLSVRGGYAESGLRNVSCSKLYIGCDGIDLSTGITCSNIEEARLTNAMMNVSAQTVVLADSSKFGRRGFGKICGIEDIDIIITDSGIPDSVRNKIEDMGTQVIIADAKY
jgi:DeoR family transcriptional regulator, aga operon transcriptional repressor